MSSLFTDIPHIGPVQREMLTAAGIETTGQLARASVEQIVSVTGLSRVEAEAVHAAVNDAAESDDTLPPVDEAFPLPDAPPANEEDAPETPAELPMGALDRTVFRVRTAASDVTRRQESSAPLTRALAALSHALDPVPARAETLTPAALRRLARRLDTLAARLERYAASVRRPDAARQTRLRERVAEEQAAIKAALRTSRH